MEEKLPLLFVSRRSSLSVRGSRCATNLCIRSKAARLILLWNASILLGYKLLFDINTFMQVSHSTIIPIVATLLLSMVAVVSPLAGILADTKCSRHKAVLCSSYAMIVMLILIPILTVTYSLSAAYLKRVYLFKIGAVNPLILSAFFCIVVLTVIEVIFLINGFQFGMDQLHDSSTEDIIVFLHWYVWMYYISSLITETATNLIFYDSIYFAYFDTVRIVGLSSLGLSYLAIFLLLVISLCVAQRRKKWFVLDPPGRANSYRLVYKVIKFACRHKKPLNRSAFTYCEDEKPSRMDLGKSKYGGPFTTKEVEDVKAFLSILKLLIFVSPAFYLQAVVQSLLPTFASHDNFYIQETIENSNETFKHQVHPEGVIRHLFVSNGLLSPLLVTLSIPLYLWFIRPHIVYHIPGMLKRIGMGMVLMILSLLCALVMDVVVHVRKTKDATCMFNGYTTESDAIHHHSNYTDNSFPTNPLYQNVYFFVSQHILSSLIDMLLDIAVLEFICSQSPYSMKGLLFGVLFSLRNLFQCLAVLSILPFSSLSSHFQLLSCGSVFYLCSIVIAVLAMCLFTCVARRYKYRIVNEPSNEYYYAEEYYSNIQ